MGVWATPFKKVARARQLRALLEKPVITVREDSEALYNLVGCDELFDELDNVHLDDNVKDLVLHILDRWLDNLHQFDNVGQRSVAIVTKAVRGGK